MKNLLVVVNSDSGTIPKSATFIHAHIDALRCQFNVTTVLGNPGRRKIAERSQELQSQSLFGRLLRKAGRTLTGSSVSEQDSGRMIELIRDENIDCVFAEFGVSGAGVATACEVTNKPLVVHFHGYDAYRKDILETYEKDYENLFRIASQIIVVSNDMSRSLTDRFGHSHKIKLNPCGANLSLLNNVKNVQKNLNQIVSVGRLTPKKDPLGTIKAFQRIAITYPETRLLMIGDGELYQKCDALIQELELNNNVIMLGWLSHEEALKKIAQSKIFIMNSVTATSGDKEGTPVALMEAMALKTIPIATYHGGIPDIIIDGTTGFLYKEHDYKKLTSLIEKAIKMDNPEKITDKSYLYSTQNLDISIKNTNLVTIIKECIQ